MTCTAKPTEATWRTAKLYDVDFTCIYLMGINKALPVSGGRLAWVVRGRKWVRICLPVCNTKFRMTRTQWDASPTRLVQ